MKQQLSRLKVKYGNGNININEIDVRQAIEADSYMKIYRSHQKTKAMQMPNDPCVLAHPILTLTLKRGKDSMPRYRYVTSVERTKLIALIHRY